MPTVTALSGRLQIEQENGVRHRQPGHCCVAYERAAPHSRQAVDDSRISRIGAVCIGNGGRLGPELYCPPGWLITSAQSEDSAPGRPPEELCRPTPQPERDGGVAEGERT